MVTLVKGQKFGRLEVVQWIPSTKTWECLCECGNTTFARSNSMKKGKHKSCGCLNREPRPHKRLPNSLALKRSLYNNYRSSANKRQYQFNLSLDEFVELIEQDCHYCGMVPTNSENSANIINHDSYKYNGVDRVDNTKGYSLDNCVPCCTTCNLSKLDLSVHEFKSWIERVYKKMFND